jgi:hypothetical protein
MLKNHRNNFVRSGVAAVLLAVLWACGMSDSVSGKSRSKIARPSTQKQVVQIETTTSSVSLSADLDGDRKADRISIQNQPGSYEVEIDLTTKPGSEITLEGDSGPAVGLAVLDTNSDWTTDIVVATASTTEPINFWIGDGQGGFELQEPNHVRMNRHLPASHPSRGAVRQIAQLTANPSIDVRFDSVTTGIFPPSGSVKVIVGPGDLLPRGPDPNVIGKRGPPHHTR